MPVVVKLRLRQACSGVTIQVMAEDASYGADSVWLAWLVSGKSFG